MAQSTRSLDPVATAIRPLFALPIILARLVVDIIVRHLEHVRLEHEHAQRAAADIAARADSVARRITAAPGSMAEARQILEASIPFATAAAIPVPRLTYTPLPAAPEALPVTSMADALSLADYPPAAWSVPDTFGAAALPTLPAAPRKSARKAPAPKPIKVPAPRKAPARKPSTMASAARHTTPAAPSMADLLRVASMPADAFVVETLPYDAAPLPGAPAAPAAPAALRLYTAPDGWYEAYGDDAVAISKAVDNPLTFGNDRPMIGFPQSCLEEYLRRLLKAGHRVAICDRDGEPKVSPTAAPAPAAPAKPKRGRKVSDAQDILADVRGLTPALLAKHLERASKGSRFDFIATAQQDGVATDGKLLLLLTDAVRARLPQEQATGRPVGSARVREALSTKHHAAPAGLTCLCRNPDGETQGVVLTYGTATATVEARSAATARKIYPGCTFHLSTQSTRGGETHPVIIRHADKAVGCIMPWFTPKGK